MDINVTEHMAVLAGINLSAEEKVELTRQINIMLQYVEKLDELDTEAVEPLHHILPLYNVFREDHAVESPARSELLANASQHEDGFYKVPRIL